MRTIRWRLDLGVAFAGLATTLTLKLAFENARLEPGPAAQTEESGDQPFRLEVGESGPSGSPIPVLERYVLDGETDWEPVLRQWRDSAFVQRSRGLCRLENPADETATRCSVEYHFTTRAEDDGGHVIQHVAATVRPGDSSVCRRYVTCRIEGYLNQQLALPSSYPHLTIMHRVVYDGRRLADEEILTEIEALQRSLARVESADLSELPAPAQRMQRLLDLEKRQRLQVLLEESSQRGLIRP